MNQWNSRISIACQALAIFVCLRPDAMALPLVSDWLAPSNGNWTDGSKWSTAPFFPNNDSPNLGDEYHALIDAIGEPYTVTLDGSVAVSSVTIDSPDATLSLASGQLAADVIDLARGVLILGDDSDFSDSSEAEIVGATIMGSDGQLRISGRPAATPVFNKVTLGVDVVVPSSGLSPPPYKTAPAWGA